jgi:hypothetical protein
MLDFAKIARQLHIVRKDAFDGSFNPLKRSSILFCSEVLDGAPMVCIKLLLDFKLASLILEDVGTFSFANYYRPVHIHL